MDVKEPSDDPTPQDEDDRGSVDDEFRALLAGLRTTLPGTQALFGFLLILPFQTDFSRLGSLGRTSYYTAFITAAVASILLIAPAAHQRLRAPSSGIQRRSRKHLRIEVWITIGGTIALAVALAAAVFLITYEIFSSAAAGVVGGTVTALTALAWFYIPLVTFKHIE